MDCDAIYEILSWMPAKSAIKYSSSLCRPLHNIHREPNFAEKQCLHSHAQDTAFFVHPTDDSSPFVEFHALPSHGPASSGIPPESIDSIRHWGRIASSSNSLLLLARKTAEHTLSARCPSSNIQLRVFNPATGASASLPTPPDFRILLRDGVFEWSSFIECCPTASFPNDYTIALLVETELTTDPALCDWGKLKTNLLMYANGKWEEELCNVDVEGHDLRLDMPVAVFSKATQGLVVHYLCTSQPYGTYVPYIVAFDIRKKRLWRNIELPEGAWDVDGDRGVMIHYRLWIFKWNEAGICLVRRFMGVYKMWVLDECNGLSCSEAWRMVMNMTEQEMGLGNREEEKVHSFGVASGRGFLVATKARMYVYVTEGVNRGRLQTVGEYKLAVGRWS